MLLKDEIAVAGLTTVVALLGDGDFLTLVALFIRAQDLLRLSPREDIGMFQGIGGIGRISRLIKLHCRRNAGK